MITLRINFKIVLIFGCLVSAPASSDDFFFNTPNNHGTLGVINIPSARFYDAPSGSISLYRGFPDRKLNLTLSPYNWMEASIFYTSIKGKPYPGYTQDYKDKGLNLKFKLKDEGKYPAIAIGFNDIAGTGYYSSEYIVTSYGYGNTDFHFGVSWGQLNHHSHLKNPFLYLSDQFKIRDSSLGRGGKVNLKDLFAGEKLSLFAGINHLINDNLLLKVEYDPTKTPGNIGLKQRRSDINFGINFLRDKFILGLNYERRTNLSFNISFRDRFKMIEDQYKQIRNYSSNRYSNLIRINQLNNIGISQIKEKENKIFIDFTQNTHQYQHLVNLIDRSLEDSGFTETVVKNYKIAGLNVIKQTDNDEQLEEIYRNNYKGINQSFSLQIRPFLAGREDFIKAALLLEHDAEFIFSENLFFSTNLKLSLIDNFDDLIYPPVEIYPAQVRSDIKKYLNNLGERPSIGRAQFEYFKTLRKNNHIMLTLGIYEDMFAGYGFEYLNFKHNRKFNWGYEAHKVYKRDYKFAFGLLGYKNITHHLNLYYQNKSTIPFDVKLSFGEYLAGDVGTTLDISKEFKGGVVMGAFASFTDVSFDQYGEGSFDKGIYFKIPFGRKKELVNFVWRPLTKDPASKLIKKNDIYSLVKKYSDINLHN